MVRSWLELLYDKTLFPEVSSWLLTDNELWTFSCCYWTTSGLVNPKSDSSVSTAVYKFYYAPELTSYLYESCFFLDSKIASAGIEDRQSRSSYSPICALVLQPYAIWVSLDVCSIQCSKILMLCQILVLSPLLFLLYISSISFVQMMSRIFWVSVQPKYCIKNRFSFLKNL